MKTPICRHHRVQPVIKHYPATVLTRAERRTGLDKFEAQSYYEETDVTTLPESYRCTACGNQHFRYFAPSPKGS